MQETKIDKNEIRERRQPTYKKLVRWLWVLVIGGVLATILLFTVLSFQDLPTFEELENPKNNLASQVYDSKGEVIGRYFVENRVPVSYDALSPHLIDALVATEDERYHEHSGIDLQALMRVFFKTGLLMQKSSGGGSTITQQLAKLLYTDHVAKNIFERGLQKLKEWITSLKLEKSYTKEEIMAMYLNEFNFINGAYGIRAASEIYFGKNEGTLSIEEAATLIGMLKNPALFNPVRRPDTVKHRRMVVLDKMKDAFHVTEEEYDSLRLLPLDMTNFNRKTHADGLAPYFRMELRKELFRILAKKENLKPNGEKYNIFQDGIKVFTTLDPVMQKHAEDAMWEHMLRQQNKFDRLWYNKDPWTHVTAETKQELIDEEITQEEIDEDLAQRARKLKRLIRESSRYQKLREAYMTSIVTKIAKNIDGYELLDRDIDRMLKEEEEGGNITDLVKRKMISSSRAAKYRRVMKSDQWTALKRDFDNFQTSIKNSFDKRVKMTVFAYNDKKEKDTLMSPLDSIKYHKSFLQIGSIAVDPVTGHVKAWVGGINHKYFQYDHVTSERQVGSTFKPFIYATAIAQQGMSPCYEVLDQPYTILPEEGNFGLKEPWTPNNADGKFSGEKFTLMRGLQWSKNTVSVYLMKQMGDTEPVRTLVDNMGLKKDAKRSNGTLKIPPSPSLCLGATDLTVMELTGAYTSFANSGRYNKPIFISRIEDKNGKLIYEELPEDRQALEEGINHVMIQMLKKVMNQGLPGFQKIKSEIAGKTGTTNDYVDGWFMGVTPDLVVGTWVGGDERWIRFLTLSDGIGAKMARPYYARFLASIENDPECSYDVNARFKIPDNDIGIELDCSIYEQMRNEDMIEGEENNQFEEEGMGGDDFGEDEGFEEEPEEEFEEEDEDFEEEEFEEDGEEEDGFEEEEGDGFGDGN